MNADYRMYLDDAVAILSNPEFTDNKHDRYNYLAGKLTDWVAGELDNYLGREDDADLVRNIADLIVLGMIKQHDHETRREGAR